MGLFENLGRKIEEFTQDAARNAADPTHHCEKCNAEFFTDYDQCPDCGSDAVAPCE